jgi:hypothetical protein
LGCCTCQPSSQQQQQTSGRSSYPHSRTPAFPEEDNWHRAPETRVSSVCCVARDAKITAVSSLAICPPESPPGDDSDASITIYQEWRCAGGCGQAETCQCVLFTDRSGTLRTFYIQGDIIDSSACRNPDGLDYWNTMTC